MNNFIEFVARRKAWQVFLILVLPMFASQFYLVAHMPRLSSSRQPLSIEEFEVLFSQTMLLSLLMVVLLLSWLLSIGLAANQRIEQRLRPRTRLVIGGAAYAASYIMIAPFIFPGPSSFASGDASLGIVVPLHFLAMIAMLYVLAFSAKNLIMAERQSLVSFFDYSGPFFLMWFFPIGVWFVQPRVNRLVEVDVGESQNH